MFEYQTPRHPLQTFQFWFVILICSGAVAAWRFDLFHPQSSELTISTAAFDIIEEEMPPPPSDLGISGESTPITDVIAAPLQFEEEPDHHPAELPATGAPVTNPFSTAPPQADELQQVVGSSSSESVAGQGLIQQASLQAAPPQLPANAPQLQTPDTMTPPERPATPPSLAATPFDIAEVDRLISSGDDVAALRILSTRYWQVPEERRELRGRINQLSRRIYFQPHPHYMQPYEVQFGDRLELIAKKYNVTWEYLAKINRVEPQRIRAGQKLKVIQGPFSVVVDTTKFELTVHAHGYVVVRMPVGIGQDESTPLGTFQVTDKVVDPIYYGPDGVIKNDDPSNPLGERWLAISDAEGTIQGYGIHGTIDPDSIGKAESRGCIRLHDQDVADLYDLLTIGSEVIIRR